MLIIDDEIGYIYERMNDEKDENLVFENTGVIYSVQYNSEGCATNIKRMLTNSLEEAKKTYTNYIERVGGTIESVPNGFIAKLSDNDLRCVIITNPEINSLLTRISQLVKTVQKNGVRSQYYDELCNISKELWAKLIN